MRYNIFSLSKKILFGSIILDDGKRGFLKDLILNRLISKPGMRVTVAFSKWLESILVLALFFKPVQSCSAQLVFKNPEWDGYSKV